jgi:LPPG:FO 2-phospho-L-lactate transferase
MVETVEYGTLAFQEYFVRYRWQPTVTRLWYEGADRAHPTTGLLDALTQADAIVICPSNPMLSIEPMEVSPVGVAAYYGNLIDGLIVDTADQDITIPQQKFVTNTLMQTPDDRVKLAREVMEWVGSWQKDKI